MAGAELGSARVATREGCRLQAALLERRCRPGGRQRRGCLAVLAARREMLDNMKCWAGVATCPLPKQRRVFIAARKSTVFGPDEPSARCCVPFPKGSIPRGSQRAAAAESCTLSRTSWRPLQEKPVAAQPHPRIVSPDRLLRTSAAAAVHKHPCSLALNFRPRITLQSARRQQRSGGLATKASSSELLWIAVWEQPSYRPTVPLDSLSSRSPALHPLSVSAVLSCCHHHASLRSQGLQARHLSQRQPAKQLQWLFAIPWPHSERLSTHQLPRHTSAKSTRSNSGPGGLFAQHSCCARALQTGPRKGQKEPAQALYRRHDQIRRRNQLCRFHNQGEFWPRKKTSFHLELSLV